MVRPPIAVLVAFLLTLAACDESDVVAVRVRLRDDLSGTLRTSGLVLPGGSGPVEQASEGATWGSRVEMVCASGSFVDLSKLKIADIAFAAGEGGPGIGFVKVVLPRGPDVRWPKSFSALSEEERKSVAGALDPSGKTEAVGSTLKLEIELPSSVIGNGVIGKTRGTKVSAEGSVATLVVPFDTMLTPGDPITWHLTWQR